jgi:hypothetical protein
MRTRWLAALVVGLAAAGAASAQPAKAPTVEFRLRSVTDLFGKAEYVAGLAGKDDVVKQVWQVVQVLSTDGKDLEGLDLKRPFGVYATLTENVIDSPVTVMVPIADADKFLGLLKERAQIDVKKNDDGTYKVPLPEQAANPVIDAVFVRFANEYAYIGRTAKDLDPKGLIAPKAFFAKDDGSVGSLIVRVDAIPEKVRTLVLGELELLVNEAKKRDANMSPAEKAAADLATDLGVGAVKTFLEDAKEVALRVFIDEKGDDLSAELTVTAKPGTTLAKNLADLGGKSSLPAGIVATKNPAARASAKGALPADARKRLEKVIDEAAKEMVGKAGGAQEAAVVQKIVDAVSPTLKAAELDLAVTLSAPNAKGKHTLLAALAVKDGKGIEKLAKEFAPFAAGAADFTFDVAKVGDFSLHKVVLNDVPPEFEDIFGTKTIWLATSDKLIAASVEPDGEALKAGLKAAAVPVPALDIELSAARLLPLVARDLKPDEVKALLKDAFGDSPAGKDTVTVTITGGEQLTAKAKIKGKAVKLLLGVAGVKFE